MKKVMVFGTYDILHKGHLHFFGQARKYGDYLIVVVARSKNVKKIKGKLPRRDECRRIAEIIPYAEKVVLGSSRKGYSAIKRYSPDMICLGYDQEADIEELKKFNIPIKRLRPFKPHIYKSSKM